MALKIRCLKNHLKVLDLIIMSKNSEKLYYAVGRGRQTGIYDSWSECKAQTEGFQNSKYRKFYSLEDAQEFVDFWKNYSTPELKSVEPKNSEESDGKEEKPTDDIKASVNDDPVTTLLAVKQEPTSIHQDSSSVFLPPSSLNLNFNDRRNWNQNNADILALNLRFDSFERRFDSFLKDIGAISSEISHLRHDVKELLESLKTFKEFNSPKKGKDGLLQTTLNFVGSPVASLRSLRRNSSDLDEPKRKKKCIKRKLSKSNSSESLKDDENDALDEIIASKKKEVDETSFTVDEEGFVEVYTDGSSRKNGRVGAKAGIGIWFGDEHPLNISEPVVGSPTNVTAEIQAARVAIQLAIKYGVTKLKIFTDSEFVINCATKWIHRWKKNGWTLSEGGPVKNKKELEKLDKYMSRITVRWEKVQGHANIKGNEIADRLANEGAAKFRR